MIENIRIIENMKNMEFVKSEKKGLSEPGIELGTSLSNLETKHADQLSQRTPLFGNGTI